MKITEQNDRVRLQLQYTESPGIDSPGIDSRLVMDFTIKKADFRGLKTHMIEALELFEFEFELDNQEQKNQMKYPTTKHMSLYEFAKWFLNEQRMKLQPYQEEILKLLSTDNVVMYRSPRESGQVVINSIIRHYEKYYEQNFVPESEKEEYIKMILEELNKAEVVVWHSCPKTHSHTEFNKLKFKGDQMFISGFCINCEEELMRLKRSEVV